MEPRNLVLLIIGLSIAVSGCTSTDNGESLDLNKIVISESDVGKDYNMTHASQSNSSSYENSSIVESIHRRFLKNDTETTFLLSSATIYENSSTAEKVENQFIAGTTRGILDNSSTIHVKGENVTEIKQVTFYPIRENYYLYKRDNELIYFVAVSSEEFKIELGQDLFSTMMERLEDQRSS